MTTTALARCHCGAFCHNVVFQPETFAQYFCHCDTCRHVSGNLYTSARRVEATRELVATAQETLQKYETSAGSVRYFCGTCGSHVMCVSGDTWKVFLGAIDQGLGNLNGSGEPDGSRVHIFVADTKDGGLTHCFPPTDLYMAGGYNSTRLDAAQVESMQKLAMVDLPSKGEDSLQASCHCGDVQFSISRPQEGITDHTFPRWSACLCSCRSCRLSFGQSITSFLGKMPFSSIRWSDSTVHDGSVRASVTRYQGSSYAQRDFCKRCGASVFYTSTYQTGRLDVALGLLRAIDGALARSWAKWDTSKIHFKEEAYDEELIAAVGGRLHLLEK